ncbi:polygalacturonase-1 non-catalytic subunit beta-like [Macadamia integrifolia]|uniref:polygalacturonase-1 non-catalytic subunit beta-like n=1 Tax=Macadamia integrifolia TaxID=60698 RepID=UPI001C4E3C92|nr:polygalacturonase-1 non-catalytic subunit beta-like [Macadamia integrifolia]
MDIMANLFTKFTSSQAVLIKPETHIGTRLRPFHLYFFNPLTAHLQFNHDPGIVTRVLQSIAIGPPAAFAIISKTFSCHTLGDSQTENAFSHYWEEHIGLLDPPQWLISKTSPLSLDQLAVFMKLMEENELASHMHSLCEQANVVCSTNALMKKIYDTNLPSIIPLTDAKKIYEGLPKETPLSIASQGGLLFFGSQIDELKKLFGVVDDSNMDEYIQDTLKICEKSSIQCSHCTCATSAEDLIDFIIEKLGHHVGIWSTENVEESYENVTDGAMKLIYGNLSEPPVICHSQPFPFQVYFCHILQKVKAYTVDIHARKKGNDAIMACHYDTSTWNPNHLAFKLLGFGPGPVIEVCH